MLALEHPTYLCHYLLLRHVFLSELHQKVLHQDASVRIPCIAMPDLSESSGMYLLGMKRFD